jgi:hypothetical protein
VIIDEVTDSSDFKIVSGDIFIEGNFKDGGGGGSSLATQEGKSFQFKSPVREEATIERSDDDMDKIRARGGLRNSFLLEVSHGTSTSSNTTDEAVVEGDTNPAEVIFFAIKGPESVNDGFHASESPTERSSWNAKFRFVTPSTRITTLSSGASEKVLKREKNGVNGTSEIIPRH